MILAHGTVHHDIVVAYTSSAVRQVLWKPSSGRIVYDQMRPAHNWVVLFKALPAQGPTATDTATASSTDGVLEALGANARVISSVAVRPRNILPPAGPGVLCSRQRP